MTRASGSYNTKGIVLARTDFGEADRILTFLTNDHGKIKALAKGVRKAKAKLAGSIELFSVSDLTVIPGRRDINTLISARLINHYGQIVKSLERTQLGYEILRLTNKSIEDQPEPEYFEVLKTALRALDSKAIEPAMTEIWFSAQLLRLAGHSPNLSSDRHGAKLKAERTYDFHVDNMHFVAELAEAGPYTASHIKFLRLAFSSSSPAILQRVKGGQKLAEVASPLVQAMLRSYVRV